MWNLMSRSESVDSLMLQHIDWECDALVIEEQGHKGDQIGERNMASTFMPTHSILTNALYLLLPSFCSVIQKDRVENNNYSLEQIAKIDSDIYYIEFYYHWMKVSYRN
jgi:hypothetical protein